MKVNLLSIKGSWHRVADAARTTVNKEPGQGDPSSEWKRKILLAEHSPIRKIIISWKWTELPWWVQTHFTRHKVGVEWFVRTSRSDRTGVDRSTLSQDALIEVEGEANPQAIINISRKRLCRLASPETREAWQAFLETIREIEPELYSVCVPECVYRGFCPEMNSCGRTEWDREEFEKELVRYRTGEEVVA